MIRENKNGDDRSDRPGVISKFLRKRLFGLLERLEFGNISIREGLDVHFFGPEVGPSVQLVVHSPSFYRSLLGGSAGLGGAYIEGAWECSDLTKLFQIFLRNRECLNNVSRMKSVFFNLCQRVGHFFNCNSQSGSQKNIAAHYDLGNDFYSLWLDDTMTYSSGIFRDMSDSMIMASTEKLDRVCRKLDLENDSEVVEIGTGWGGFALHAARNYGCHVTTTTISEQQHDEAANRISNAGLEHKIDLLKDDYRNLSGSFDKLVSIEMIEAVGHRYLDQYFAKCSQLLKPDGSMLIQAITMPEKHYQQYLQSVDFIQKYIFPGGCLPSIGAIVESAGRSTDLRIVHSEDLAPHYAETLRRWRTEFEKNIDAIKELGYPDSFIRTWRFYLCYCEAAFEERHIGVHQLVFDKPLCRRDPITITNQAANREIKNFSELNSLVSTQPMEEI